MTPTRASFASSINCFNSFDKSPSSCARPWMLCLTRSMACLRRRYSSLVRSLGGVVGTIGGNAFCCWVFLSMKLVTRSCVWEMVNVYVSSALSIAGGLVICGACGSGAAQGVPRVSYGRLHRLRRLVVIGIVLWHSVDISLGDKAFKLPAGLGLGISASLSILFGFVVGHDDFQFVGVFLLCRSFGRCHSWCWLSLGTAGWATYL